MSSGNGCNMSICRGNHTASRSRSADQRCMGFRRRLIERQHACPKQPGNKIGKRFRKTALTATIRKDLDPNQQLRQADGRQIKCFRCLPIKPCEHSLVAIKGTWYPLPGKPRYILGFWFKPSIKGIWFYRGQAYAVLINARKGQPLTPLDEKFLARGVFELHCINDPNDPIPLIIDLSEHEEGKGRKLIARPIAPEEAVTLEAFEHTVREFLTALNLVGISQPIPPIDNVIDLFRPPK